MILLIINTLSSAKEITTVSGISEHWAGATEKGCKGFYWDVIKNVYALDNIKLKCKLSSYERGIKLTKNKKVDFWVASYKNEEAFAKYPKIAFDADMVSVLYDSSKTSFKNINDLKSKKVAWVRGYDYNEYVKFPLNFKELNSRESGIKMVSVGRLDYFIDNKDDLAKSLDTLKLKNHNLKTKKIMELKLYLGFANTKKSDKLINIWDKNMKILNKSGKLRAIYKKADYTEYYPFN